MLASFAFSFVLNDKPSMLGGKLKKHKKTGPLNQGMTVEARGISIYKWD